MRIYTVFKKGINDKKNPEDYWDKKREKSDWEKVA